MRRVLQQTAANVRAERDVPPALPAPTPSPPDLLICVATSGSSEQVGQLPGAAAVAVVINRRMKKRGMRWCRTNADALTALHVRALNAAWEAAGPTAPLVA